MCHMHQVVSCVHVHMCIYTQQSLPAGLKQCSVGNRRQTRCIYTRHSFTRLPSLLVGVYPPPGVVLLSPDPWSAVVRQKKSAETATVSDTHAGIAKYKKRQFYCVVRWCLVRAGAVVNSFASTRLWQLAPTLAFIPPFTPSFSRSHTHTINTLTYDLYCARDYITKHMKKSSWMASLHTNHHL